MNLGLQCKILAVLFLLFIIEINISSQHIDIFPSFSISSEKRFNPNLGIGIAINKDLKKKNREIGFNVTYHFFNTAHTRNILYPYQPEKEFYQYKNQGSLYTIKYHYLYSVIKSKKIDYHLGYGVLYRMFKYREECIKSNNAKIVNLMEIHSGGIGIINSFTFRMIKNEKYSLFTNVSAYKTTFQLFYKQTWVNPWFINWLTIESGIRYHF